MASWVSQELVAMHRPLPRSTTSDIPAHPSIWVIAGCTSSRMKAMPSSMAPGFR